MSSSDHRNPGADSAEWKPAANPWIIAGSVMLATFMVVLDSSVANVALPHIAGNLSASTDESTWVLTSYLVSNGIMLPASGWIARRIGRKRLLLSSILLFTAASLLCGLAINMPMLIVARVLQGIGGGGMQPLAQSILLESFPPRQHGTAMAVFGVGVVVAPVIGPTLGGWITDSYSWRWIFYINLPIGVLALFMVNLFVEDPPYLRKAFRGAIDYLGFGLMALWLGSLQLMLDKGQEMDWFATGWIRWTAAISFLALLGFIFRELTNREPIVQLHVLLDRNFSVGTLITAIYGFVLYGATAMLPLFLQTIMGYSALQSGLTVSPRGMGAMASMMVVGVLVRYFDGRLLMAFGFALLGYSTWMLSNISPRNRHGFGHPAQCDQRLRHGLHLCSAHHHDPEPPAQGRDGQCDRYLQPDAQHRRQHRHRHGHHPFGARLAGPSELSGRQPHRREPRNGADASGAGSTVLSCRGQRAHRSSRGPGGALPQRPAAVGRPLLCR
jgi:MFS transporter, DHA2 family, multidrug resistance protein